MPHWFVLTPWGAAAFILFFVSGLVESNRTPFDIPEGESEIVAGHMTEYSGFKYAIFFLGEYLGMFAISGLAVTLFLGGWQAPFSFLEFVPSYLWFFAQARRSDLCLHLGARHAPAHAGGSGDEFRLEIHAPDGFCLLLAAAVWHYGGRGLAGWLWSLGVIAAVYFILSRFLETGKKFAPRTYRFAE